MADADNDQKTEPATPKRRDEAFKRGQFVRSPDVQVAFTLIAALVVMLFEIPGTAHALRDFAVHSFQNLGRTTLSNELMLERLAEAGRRCLGLMTPMLIAVSWARSSAAACRPGSGSPPGFSSRSSTG